MTPGPISRAIVADKIAVVRRMLDAIGTLPLADLAAFTSDPRMVAAGESYLRRGLEALLDIARHVLAKGFGRGPAEYAEAARQLGEVGVASAEITERLVLMARYRNRMVHFYQEVTDSELYDLLTRRRADFDAVIREIVAWMDAHPDRVSSDE